MGIRKWVGLTTNEEYQQKLVLMHQVYLREIQREFKFGMEDKKWWWKYRSRFVGVQKHRI